jgi:hypothetical protein
MAARLVAVRLEGFTPNIVLIGENPKAPNIIDLEFCCCVWWSFMCGGACFIVLSFSYIKVSLHPIAAAAA